MKLETKQNEVILVAESDIDSYYLEHFFKENKKLYCVKDEYEMFFNGTCRVRIFYEKPE